MKTFFYYLGRLVRFGIYLSLWLLFGYALLEHYGSIQKTFSVDYFLYATLRTLIDVTALILVASAYFLANPAFKNYILWILFGLGLGVVVLYFPFLIDNVTPYILFLVH